MSDMICCSLSETSRRNLRGSDFCLSPTTEITHVFRDKEKMGGPLAFFEVWVHALPKLQHRPPVISTLQERLGQDKLERLLLVLASLTQSVSFQANQPREHKRPQFIVSPINVKSWPTNPVRALCCRVPLASLSQSLTAFCLVFHGEPNGNQPFWSPPILRNTNSGFLLELKEKPWRQIASASNEREAPSYL